MDFCRRAETCGDRGSTGRLRGFGRIQAGPDRARCRCPVLGGAGPPGRLGNGGLRNQRVGPGAGVSSLMTMPDNGSAATGRIFGVGLGPGDPELITRKAARLIGEADVIAFHSGTHGRSIARSIAAELLPPGVLEEPLVYPVTTGETLHVNGYRGAIEDFYDESAERLAVHLAAGRTVVVLCEGDPLFYGSYMYLHDRLSGRFPAEVVPGVTSVSAAAAAAGTPLVRHEDVLTVLPGTLPTPELARRLADTQGAAIMKLGRTFPAVREALAQAGRLDDALYVERASSERESVLPVVNVDPAAVPYFSIVIVPGRGRRGGELSSGESAGRLGADEVTEPPRTGPAELLVVGLGHGPDGWITPE